MSTEHYLGVVVGIQALFRNLDTLLALSYRLLRPEVFHVQETTVVQNDLLLAVSEQRNLERFECDLDLDILLRAVYRTNTILAHRPLHLPADLWLL